MLPPSTVRVVMAKDVAARWVAESAQREYRFSVLGFNTQSDVRRTASLLRSWRDGRARVAALGAPNQKMGLREEGESVEVWSEDLESLRKLAAWAESNGLQTTFIW